jgi:hypothetical protein
MTPEIPPEREERAEQLLARAAHTLTHISKLLARVGILIPIEADDPDTLISGLELSLELIEDLPLSQRTASALFTMVLRWMATLDLIMAYRGLGEQWRDAAVLDALHQVEGMYAIASGLLHVEQSN